MSLTFDLLLRSSGVTGGSGHAHIVPVDVLQKHLSVPPSQSTRLQHGGGYMVVTHAPDFGLFVSMKLKVSAGVTLRGLKLSLSLCLGSAPAKTCRATFMLIQGLQLSFSG